MRHRTFILGTRIGLALLLGGLLVAGCNPFAPKSGKKDKVVEAPKRDTVQGLFDFFEYVYTDPVRDITGYSDALHPDYLFWFTDDDQAGNPDIPEFWAKGSDVTATTKMFDGAISIRMTMTPSATPKATEACDPEVPDVLCYVYETDIDLAVEVPPEPGQSENLTLLVRGLADIAVTKDPADPSLWVIYSITDRTSALGGTAPQQPQGLEGAPSPQPTEQVTWGQLRNILQDL